MFETVPYLKRGKVRVVGPEDECLENILVALLIERFLRLKPKVLRSFLEAYEAVMPEAIVAGRHLYHSEALGEIGAGDTPAVLSVVGRALREGV
jgi:hypothetical protein